MVSNVEPPTMVALIVTAPPKHTSDKTGATETVASFRTMTNTAFDTGSLQPLTPSVIITL